MGDEKIIMQEDLETNPLVFLKKGDILKNRIDHNQARQIILRASKLYNYLIGKTFIFVSKGKNFNYFEVDFRKENFLHLLGLETKLKAKAFFEKCITNKLSNGNFDIKDDNTWKKLNRIEEALSFSVELLQGDFLTGCYQHCNVDVVLGTRKWFLGFKSFDTSTIYNPITLMDDNIEKATKRCDISKVVVICYKTTADKKYSLENCSYPNSKFTKDHFININTNIKDIFEKSRT